MKKAWSSSKAIFVAALATLAMSASLSSRGALSQDQNTLSQNAPGVVSGTYFNPLQVALLYWYPANLTTTFPLGSNPYGATFDGSHMWISNRGNGTVTEIQASTGDVLRTIKVGKNPDGMAFDGTNIWVANEGGNSVTELQASTGTVLGTFNVGTAPHNIAFDGANLWVTNYGSNNVTELQASDGSVLGTFAVGTNPVGI